MDLWSPGSLRGCLGPVPLLYPRELAQGLAISTAGMFLSVKALPSEEIWVTLWSPCGCSTPENSSWLPLQPSEPNCYNVVPLEEYSHCSSVASSCCICPPYSIINIPTHMHTHTCTFTHTHKTGTSLKQRCTVIHLWPCHTTPEFPTF